MSWPPSFPLFPIREPKRPDGHPLLGHMDETDEDDVRQMLERHPPTENDLLVLALEELKCRDRASIYRLFEEFKPK